MLSAGSLLVLELWSGEAMVAADFGHAVGGSFYVATRWHDSALSRYQPGFVLALASAKLLADNGFELWDLGGTDSSQGMRYKEGISHVVPRPTFHDLFLRARGTQPRRIEPGVVIGEAGITESDLFL
uniref:BioF2-like acetyltransferase domain-containing protein n=1 Tax=Haptolina brevifila TaxID=156173 RepID=A0A7S2CP68_9EUKA|mmetsp:Transcript_27237/g.54838  ORF Transcript_27237/g.54838 Transcript_27237/m.54838 type:complete len:127 (+) Transcript_27237:891-1271(+)